MRDLHKTQTNSSLVDTSKAILTTIGSIVDGHQANLEIVLEAGMQLDLLIIIEGKQKK